MKVLIIGGTGFIGTPLSKWLLKDSHEVSVLHRGERASDLPDGVRSLVGSRDELSALAREIESIGPDVTIDMIAMTEAATRPVLDILNGRTGRYVLASSCDVYRAYGVLVKKEDGACEPVPFDEGAPLRTKLYPYTKPEEAGPAAYDKIPIEKLVLSSASLPGTVVRLPMVYGPGDRQHRFRDVVKRMVDGRPYILLDEDYAGWRSSFGFVDNVAAAIGLATTHPDGAGGVFNVCDETTLDMKGWVDAFARALDWQGEVVTLPSRQMPAHLTTDSQLIDFAQDLVVDASKIRALLGYDEPVAFEERIARTASYEQDGLDEVDEKGFDYAAEDQAYQSARGTA